MLALSEGIVDSFMNSTVAELTAQDVTGRRSSSTKCQTNGIRTALILIEGARCMNTTEAPLFTPLSMQSAPRRRGLLLEQAHRYFGFVPNLLATMAHSLFSTAGISQCRSWFAAWNFNSWRTADRSFGRQQGKRLQILHNFA